MMTKFYDNTIVTKFIKYIISHFNLPIVPFWEPESFIRKDGVYLYNGNAYKAKKSGFPSNILDRTYFELLHPFVFGREYLNMTTRYIGVSNGYDPQTHYYLGEFLRTIKAYYGIDLMSMYNCFNGVYIDDVDFDNNYTAQSIEDSLESFGIKNAQKAQGYKVLSVPIKFGKSYHLAVDCDCQVETIPVIYDNSGLSVQPTKVLLYRFATELGEKSVGRYIKFNSGHFQKMDIEIPAMSYADINAGASEDRKPQYLGQYERFLRLLIKIPESNTSSVVVLEDGDSVFTTRLVSSYVKNPFGKLVNTYMDQLITNSIVNEEEIEGKDPMPAQLAYSSTPKLTFFNDGHIYAFSDTLLQYLLLNVISNMDDIDDNIIRVQKYIQSSDFNKANNGRHYTGRMQTGVWDDGMKDFIFKTVMESKYLPVKLDKFGYVDAETESIIMRGQVN